MLLVPWSSKILFKCKRDAIKGVLYRVKRIDSVKKQKELEVNT